MKSKILDAYEFSCNGVVLNTGLLCPEAAMKLIYLVHYHKIQTVCIGLHCLPLHHTSSTGEKPLIPDRPTKAHASRNASCLLYELPTNSRSCFASSDNLQKFKHETWLQANMSSISTSSYQN
jgi:hypothetical protein